MSPVSQTTIMDGTVTMTKPVFPRREFAMIAAAAGGSMMPLKAGARKNLPYVLW
jgi:hypothetical protein